MSFKILEKLHVQENVPRLRRYVYQKIIYSTDLGINAIIVPKHEITLVHRNRTIFILLYAMFVVLNSFQYFEPAVWSVLTFVSFEIRFYETHFILEKTYSSASSNSLLRNRLIEDQNCCPMTFPIAPSSLASGLSCCKTCLAESSSGVGTDWQGLHTSYLWTMYVNIMFLSQYRIFNHGDRLSGTYFLHLWCIHCPNIKIDRKRPPWKWASCSEGPLVMSSIVNSLQDFNKLRSRRLDEF